jgi:hypothetical protein
MTIFEASEPRKRVGKHSRCYDDPARPEHCSDGAWQRKRSQKDIKITNKIDVFVYW